MRQLLREDLRDQSFGDLFKQLSEQTSTLVRQEVELARTELKEKGRQAGVGAGLIGAGGLLALGAFGALTAGLILVLALWVDAWLACLIVTASYGTGAALLAWTGKGKVQAASPPVPEQTIETLKEDVQWARRRI
jgi:Putative Actinobacterial Holin-X, holin superfamily III